MGWTAPKTYATNEDWKASDYNKYVRDNLLVCETAIATTPGQILMSRGSNSVGMGVVHTQTASGSIFESNTTTWTYLGVSIRDIRSYGVMAICVSAEMTAALLSYKVFNEEGTLASPYTWRCANSGMYNNSPQRFFEAVSTNDSMYDIQLWGRKNVSSGYESPGEIHNVRLTVIAM